MTALRKLAIPLVRDGIAIAPKLFVCSVLVSGGFVIRTLLIDGEYYTANEHIYAALKRGETPETLGLEPSTNDAEDD